MFLKNTLGDKRMYPGQKRLDSGLIESVMQFKAQ